ncbi:MAG: HdeD family acid-resistance protein [Planctomycetota bacterium]
MSIASTSIESTTDRHPAGPAYESFARSLANNLSRGWGWLMAAGIFTVMAGTAALIAPSLATGVAGILIASTLLIVGCVNLASTFFAKPGQRLEACLTGVIQVLLASVMAFYPFAALMSLTILVAAFIMADGFIRAVIAFQSRGLPGWGWTLFGGIAGIVTGLIVLVAMPQASFWVIGILVGVHLICMGAAKIALAFAGRSIAKAAE